MFRQNEIVFSCKIFSQWKSYFKLKYFNNVKNIPFSIFELLKAIDYDFQLKTISIYLHKTLCKVFKIRMEKLFPIIMDLIAIL
jgi:hypothetical protein